MLKNILPEIFLMGRERGKSNVSYNNKNIILLTIIVDIIIMT